MSLFYVDQATADRWRADGRFVLFREGEFPKMCPHPDPTECSGEHCDCSLHPPTAMIEAAKLCETCGGGGVIASPWTPDDLAVETSRCPDCSNGQRRHPVTVPAFDDDGNWIAHPDARHTNGRISTGLLAIVEWGPKLVVANAYGVDGVFVHGGDLWFTHPNPRTWAAQLPPDVDPASLVGQWTIGGRIEEAG